MVEFGAVKSGRARLGKDGFIYNYKDFNKAMYCAVWCRMAE